MELARTMLALVGLAVVVIALGLAWYWWRDRRDRARYLESEAEMGASAGPVLNLRLSSEQQKQLAANRDRRAFLDAMSVGEAPPPQNPTAG